MLTVPAISVSEKMLYQNRRMLLRASACFFTRNRQLLASCQNICYDIHEVMNMSTQEILLELRTKHNLSQEALAEKVFVSRQAVSRWETGETVPNTETLKLLSGLFDVSINTLLGAPRKLVCQCCGMPMEDSVLSREPDGTFNEEYCKWCYSDGKFAYDDMEKMIDFLSQHMANEQTPPEQIRTYLSSVLPTLNHWK